MQYKTVLEKEEVMTSYETQLEKVPIQYLDTPELSEKQKDRLWKQLADRAPLPFLARWVLYRSLRSRTFWI